MNAVADKSVIKVGATPRSHGPWWILFGAAALLVILRLHAFDLPLETDECNYAYIGQRLLAGDRLYIDVWDHQPPGVYLLFAGVISLFGDAVHVFRWVAVAFSLTSLLLLFLILRRLTRPVVVGLGVILFALASSDPGTAGEGCNREIYLNTLILAAWYFGLRVLPAEGPCSVPTGGGVSRRDDRRVSARVRADGSQKAAAWMIFLSGCALALASFIKTVVAVHWVVLALWLGTRTWSTSTQRQRLRNVVATIALFGAGPLILWLATTGYFAVTGRLNEFVDAVFLFNMSYSETSGGFGGRFVQFLAPPKQPFIFDSALPLWIGSIGATIALGVEVVRHRRQEMPAVLLLLLSSYVAVCLPGHFWPHYYYLLLPAMILTMTLAISVVVDRLVARSHDSSPRRSIFPRALVVLLYVVWPIWLLYTENQHYWRQPPFGITVRRYNSRDFWGRAQGENVRRVTDPNDEIFVFGNEAEIYYYSHRRCASRYTMITALQSGYANVDRRRATLMAELNARPPRLILVLFDERNPWEQWKRFLKTHYSQPIGWDRHDRSGEPIMFVLARKDAPVPTINWDWDRSAVNGWMLGERP